MVDSIYVKKVRRKRNCGKEQAAKDRYWKIPICYDDDEDYTIAITPVLPTKEPVNSLINNPTPLEAFKEHSETIIDSNNDSSSSEDDSYENIDYVDASPPYAEIISLEVVEIVVSEIGGIDTNIILTIKDGYPS
ncbi:hypothetical protein Tco_1285946 [Tanacetum coccineum]